MKRLSRNDIVEITGITALDSLIDLEILFTTCNEIDSLEECINLKRLSMIDNGLQCISNLRCVGSTLLSLCLCDQAITSMANLDLPNLQELYLHRNLITRISGLNGCPRLKKLWLCQNNIAEMSGLHCVPELEECFLQANNIAKIGGLEANILLKSLGLAGNKIRDYDELGKLSNITSLTDLSLVDIHFGKSPITDDPGYKDFVATFLPNIRVLDGVAISRESQQTAEASYSAQLKAFDEALRAIEDEYRVDIQRVDQQLKTRETHSSILENEMTAAINELQSLITEGREMISAQNRKQDELADKNLRWLDQTLLASAEKVKVSLDSALSTNLTETDTSLAYFCLAERFASAEAEIIQLLHNTIEQNNSNVSPTKKSNSNNNSSEKSLYVFQAVNSVSPDFLYYETLLAKGITNTTATGNNNSIINGNTTLISVELLAMFRIAPFRGNHSIRCVTSNNSAIINNNNTRKTVVDRSDSTNLLSTTPASVANTKKIRVYTVATVDDFREIYLHTSNAWQSNSHLSNRLFCSSPELVSLLCEEANNSFKYDFLHELNQSKVFESCPELIRLENMERLQSALNTKFVCILGCWLDWAAVGLDSNPSLPSSSDGLQPKLQLPSDGNTRRQWLNELSNECGVCLQHIAISSSSSSVSATASALPINATAKGGRATSANKSSRPTTATAISTSDRIESNNINSSSSSNNHFVLSVPNDFISIDTAAIDTDIVNQQRLPYQQQQQDLIDKLVVSLDSVSICAVHNRNTRSDSCSNNSSSIAAGKKQTATATSSSSSLLGPVRDIEHKLEMLLLPCVSADRTSALLATFDSEVSSSVNNFIDHMLEELDEEASSPMRAAEAQLAQQEAKLRQLREAVDRERRSQDNVLRDLRQQQIQQQQQQQPQHSHATGSTRQSNSNSNSAPSKRK